MQKITTPQGEILVILPLADYEFLVDGNDIAAADRIKSEIAAGNDELVPAAVVTRLLAGEHPVKVWRTHRGQSAKALADATGLSAPYISEIETGKKEGSIAAMKTIAEALDLGIEDLV